MKAHPFAEEYPTMPQADLDRMTEDMKEHGYDRRFPIVIFKRSILDGRSRYAAAKAAKIKPKTIEFKGSEEQARQFVITANEHRRHLTPDWLEAKRQERIGRVAEARAEGKSLRAIAEDEGVSKTQVAEDLKAAAETCPGVDTSPPDGKVTDSLGRKQPATKPDKRCQNCIRKQPQGKSAPGCEACKAIKRGREIGDEPVAKRPSANGQLAYDWKPFHDGFGILRRQIDTLGNIYGAKESGEAGRLRDKLSEWKQMFKEWFEVVSRSKAPTE